MCRGNLARRHFPSFSEGLSLRLQNCGGFLDADSVFPFLFGGTFIEASLAVLLAAVFCQDFPSFSEGLSLRPCALAEVEAQTILISLPFLEGLSLRRRRAAPWQRYSRGFPFLSDNKLPVRNSALSWQRYSRGFPFLSGGAFIEAAPQAHSEAQRH